MFSIPCSWTIISLAVCLRLFVSISKEIPLRARLIYKNSLLQTIKRTFANMPSGVDQTRIINVFNRVAPQLARENKKFQISKVASEQYPDIRYGIKLSKNNIGHEDKIYTFPYFCSFLLKRFMSGFHAEEEAE